MTSSSADWVFGEARLISSASTIAAKIGPWWNSNELDFWSKIVTPVTSLGRRSGVNWMRLWFPCTVCAIERASVVLPVPGKSSSSRCPSASMQVTESRIASVLPRITRSMLRTIDANVSENQRAWSGVIAM